jgi:hypothetical protein
MIKAHVTLETPCISYTSSNTMKRLRVSELASCIRHENNTKQIIVKRYKTVNDTKSDAA